MLAEYRTGPIVSSDAGINPGRASKDGGIVLTPGSGDYEEMAYRGLLFSASNQGPGGTTTTVGLAATYTGLCINNPANSGKNLVLFHFGLSVVGAPAALSTVGLLAGYAQAGVVTHTTPLIPLSTFVNQIIATGVAKADAACTLVGTPALLLPLATIPVTGATAQVVNPPVSGVYVDLKGGIIIPPGAYIAAYTSTVLTVIAGFVWGEKAI